MSVKLTALNFSCQKYNDAYDTIVSADDKGMVEYWSPREPFELAEVPGMWKYKSDTDLYEFKKVSLPHELHAPGHKLN